MSDGPWYGVRCVFEIPDGDLASGDHWYEERVTLWHAASAEEAISSAEAEGDDYAEAIGAKRIPLAQSFHLAVPGIGNGIEVFSLIRGSRRGPADYVDAFFDTGTERQQGVSGP